ncbi:hypothetical protein Q4E93_06585 [Flavitalea sp. BT771]|uniref:hypothetical protein n=1 Tax=Flavitalea sp. BT771 TaxID=3063329 RepID=UPI0026E1CA19|nr:hypothetical protein [Flavitalea sp. BT771]MDO6430242.1 hypothetical protein [Flavitalea sp. BT771]MDV6219618.1 hypothetical protein [Flavitalea sp. BT771]
MISTDIFKRERYYTASYEWIDFHDMEAFVGIAGCRLTGIRQVKKIEFVRLYGFKRRGEVLANVQFNSQRFQVHMPVDGSIISINNIEALINEDLLLSKPETEGWLVKILVSQPCERKGLIPFEQYNSTI